MSLIQYMMIWNSITVGNGISKSLEAAHFNGLVTFTLGSSLLMTIVVWFEQMRQL